MLSGKIMKFTLLLFDQCEWNGMNTKNCAYHWMIYLSSSTFLKYVNIFLYEIDFKCYNVCLKNDTVISMSVLEITSTTILLLNHINVWSKV